MTQRYRAGDGSQEDRWNLIKFKRCVTPAAQLYGIGVLNESALSGGFGRWFEMKKLFFGDAIDDWGVIRRPAPRLR